jgi:multicomponent Na+:H+ antiporter subunit F
MILATSIAFVFLAAALLLAFIRLARGPSLADRVLAVDHITILAMGIIAVWGLVSAEPAALDLAIVIALVGFLATVALARYLEMRQETEIRDGSQESTCPHRRGRTTATSHNGGTA